MEETQTQTQTLTLSDADVQRISQAVSNSLSGVSGDVVARLDGLHTTILAASDGINANVAAVASDSSVSQTVSVSGEQWQHVTDSLNLNSALSMFTLALVAVIVGMRFFSEFSRGFRRA